LNRHGRSSRRAYIADGTEARPATVGGERALGYRRAEIWCSSCNHHGEVSTDGMPSDLPIPDICLRYRCSRCGGKQLLSRMSIDEFYEVL
jgi:Zn finger protein HypA/HybF involved in hydrogenase expression